MSDGRIPFVDDQLTPESWKSLALAAVLSEVGVSLVLTELDLNNVSRGGIVVITHIPDDSEGQVEALRLAKREVFGHCARPFHRIAYAFVEQRDDGKRILDWAFENIWHISGLN